MWIRYAMKVVSCEISRIDMNEDIIVEKYI